MKMGDEESLLRKMGAELQSLDSGCCGMAGAFGFEADKYAVSQAVGERVLLPAVRAAAAETVIVSDGFSCREQIQQATGRRAHARRGGAADGDEERITVRLTTWRDTQTSAERSSRRRRLRCHETAGLIGLALRQSQVSAALQWLYFPRSSWWIDVAA